MLSKEKRIRQKFLQADFNDNVMFEMAMSKAKFCKRLLQSVLPEFDFQQIKVVVPKQSPSSDLTQVGCIDLLCIPKIGDRFNVKLQLVAERNLALRSRYYHAMMVEEMLATDEDYRNLRDTYVIFLGAFDWSHAINHYQMMSEHGDDILEDGTHTIILNAKSNWDEADAELRGVFQLILKEEATYGYLGPKVANDIARIKQSELGGEKYMALTDEFWQDIRDEGRQEGKAEERRELVPLLVKILADNGKQPAEIMAYLEAKLGLSVQEAEEYYQLAITEA
ncbi:hypothetical protein FC14_GL000222 [Ligilactobacillus agilis DSM 20509]|uniref:Rpn family recombination-promoting nuclease/putative transposase n=1 Tax=Ligilactobacillus agilis DSM 20509 TaxID=1423718 RepID=A0A0R2AK67_9LACO|nr:PD-(D/E)XK nuclease family transposase [Ligilactobacillus agilis]KRM63763.1 hypothetical protein FC14_GL000222 [Ligilactobacillus agilis DSM 20509]